MRINLISISEMIGSEENNPELIVDFSQLSKLERIICWVYIDKEKRFLSQMLVHSPWNTRSSYQTNEDWIIWMKDTIYNFSQMWYDNFKVDGITITGEM